MAEEIRLHRKKCLREIVLFILLLCSLIAVMIEPDSTSLYDESLNGMAAFFSLLRDELGEAGIGHTLAAGLLIFLYHKYLLQEDGKVPFCRTACILGGIFAFFLVLGISFSAYTNFDFIFYRKAQFPIAVITFVGCWVILYTCLKLLYAKLDTLKIKSKVYTGILERIGEHFLLICIVVMLVVWILQMLPFFPGSVPYDGRYQLNQFFGFQNMTTQHPYASTMILGAVYSVGKALFGAVGGCVFYVGFQSILGAIVFGQICEYIRKKTGLLGAGMAALIFFACAPMFWAYMQTLDKSALYMIVFAWFSLEYAKLLLHDGGRFGLFRVLPAAALVCILRSEGFYVVLPAMILLVILLSDKRKLAVLALAAVILWNYGWNTVYMDYLGIGGYSGSKELFSIGLQMVARYDLYYGDELTEEEKEIIDSALVYEGLGERYDPELADPVKNQVRSGGDKQAFIKLFLKLFTRHPIIYLEAAVNEIYGYIDPFYFYYGMSAYQFYNKEPLTDTDADVVYSEYAFSDNVRIGVSDAVYSWNQIPILSLIVNPAAYTWMGMILLGGLLRKRRFRDALFYVTPLMVILVCFASPVNGLVRYMLPVMAAMPLYILVGLRPYLPDVPDRETVI